MKEAAVGFVEDVGHQVFVEDKSLDEVDYGQAVKAGATAGVTAMAGEVLDAVAPRKQVSIKNKKKVSQATSLIADAADSGPRPKADVLPEGKVKGTVGSAGKANVAVGNHAVGDAVAGGAKKKQVNGTVKTGSTGGISKNQQKVQSQTTGRSYLGAKKTTIGVTSILEDNTKKVEYPSKEDILKHIDGVTEKSTEIAEKIRNKEIGISILSDEMFETWTGEGSNVMAAQVKKNIYLRKSLSPVSAYSCVVHEGTHALDYLAGMPEDMLGCWAGETRAYTEERLFQLAAKLPVDFLNEDDMMVHIWSEYERVRKK